MTLADKNVNKNESGVDTRRRRLPEAARENILSAAEAMLIASGPQSLKLAEVAKAAGVSNASVLHHFGSIGEVQAALMERMVRRLVDEVLTLSLRTPDSAQSVREGVTALFDAFENRGAARLAAWLELSGEARRLTSVRSAVSEVIDARVKDWPHLPREALEDFLMACITLALGVGLFGSTLGELLGAGPARARHVALTLLYARLQLGVASV